LKLVGRVPVSSLAEGRMVRLPYPPFHVLVSLVEGEACAIEDACNHAGASLSEGDREGDCVICPLHAYTFDLRTGRLLVPAGLCEDQRRFLARREGNEVAVYDLVEVRFIR
jgi:nitrite reductase/ring-hydroxylating ferredoxin subunit